VDKKWFKRYETLTRPIVIHLADKKNHDLAIGHGDIEVSSKDSDGNQHVLKLPGALHAPNLKSSLLSVNHITKLGYTVHFKDEGGHINDQTGRQVAIMQDDSNLYQLPHQKERTIKAQISDVSEQDIEGEFSGAPETPGDPSHRSGVIHLLTSAQIALKILARKPSSCKEEQLAKSVKESRGDSIRVGQRLGIPLLRQGILSFLIMVLQARRIAHSHLPVSFTDASAISAAKT
jgi:hypothetical protein